MIATVLVALTAFADDRQRILEALSVPQPLPALKAERHGQFEAERGVTIERISYATQSGLRVPALVYRPNRRKGKAPALVIVNGHGGDKYSWYAFYSGIAYARAGAVVLTYDPLGEGERNRSRESGTRAHDRVIDPKEVMGPRMGGLMVTDILQAVSYLAGRDDVDAGRIAAAGYSMGSFLLGIACAVDTRLKACVLTGGGNLDGPDGYWDRSKPMCQGEPYKALRFLDDRAAKLYALHAARGRTLIVNGTADTVVAMPTYGDAFFADLRRRVIALRGSEENIFEYRFIEGASHRPFFVTKPVALWLDQVLDLPRWTPAEIGAMEETHIGPWAAANRVEMDRLYATEEREGGTRAIGVRVPALTRDQLNILPEFEWRERKKDFLYEEWLRLNSSRAASPDPPLRQSLPVRPR